MTKKRYVRILDYSEKEVRIFDEHNKKNIFNIFFEGIDSAICLKGALEDTVDLLNYFYEEKKNLVDENEQLKQTIDDLRTYSNDEFTEAEHINNIYKEKGFCGVIEYAKEKLKYYGVVEEVEKGLWVMVTGGWSDNEFWLHCLNNPISIFSMKHYRGYLRGGAFYYTEKPRGDVKIILEGDDEI